jgi:hypothetical protein
LKLLRSAATIYEEAVGIVAIGQLQQIPLLDYVEGQDWKPARRIARGRLMGLCPLHADRKPSFLLDPNRNLFYCYGCGRRGDVIRCAELYHDVPFGEAIALLRRWSGMNALLRDVIRFHQLQLHRHPEAVAYLAERGVRQPELVEQMRIGYAPGRCLRAWLMSIGYALRDLQQAGVVTLEGFDAFAHRIVFPLDANLYGRSIGNASPHRFLPGGKGGLYRWERVRPCCELVLVEGLFDWAVLWQAGFRNIGAVNKVGDARAARPVFTQKSCPGSKSDSGVAVGQRNLSYPGSVLSSLHGSAIKRINGWREGPPLGLTAKFDPATGLHPPV